MASILVIGSSNTDMVIQVEHLPKPGETILGKKFFVNAGGKGANQAVAAARLGGNITFVTKTGRDSFGKDAIALFKHEGINTDHIFEDPDEASGVALIQVDQHGENSIAVALGANNTLSVEEINSIRPLIESASIVLVQLEIPLDTVHEVIKIARRKGIKTILNPAPAAILSEDFFKGLWLITPNETEAELLTGIAVTDIETAKQAAQKLQDKGVENVILTLGSKGAMIYRQGVTEIVAAEKVKAVDTTAAGDIFNGALTVAIAEGQELKAAVEFAVKAATISVTRLGAQASAPYRSEIK